MTRGWMACSWVICAVTVHVKMWRAASVSVHRTCLRCFGKNQCAAWQNKHENKVIRNIPGTTHNGPDVSVFTPETEITDSAHINAGSAVAPVQPEDPDLCHRVTDCTQAPPDSARQGIGRPIAFLSPPVLQKDTSKPCGIHSGERRS